MRRLAKPFLVQSTFTVIVSSSTTNHISSTLYQLVDPCQNIIKYRCNLSWNKFKIKALIDGSFLRMMTSLLSLRELKLKHGWRARINWFMVFTLSWKWALRQLTTIWSSSSRLTSRRLLHLSSRGSVVKVSLRKLSKSWIARSKTTQEWRQNLELKILFATHTRRLKISILRNSQMMRWKL